jgi:hypothetical protein
LVDGINFPHNSNVCESGKMIKVEADNLGKSWVIIDLGESKSVRSLYLAVPEINSLERLEDLRIYIGDTSTWTGDSLCWLGSPSEPAES